MKISPTRRSSRFTNAAFSLVELLVVVGVIALLLTVSGPTMSAAFKGTKLTQGAEAVRNFLTLAHQTAIKNNLPVEVRFYKYDDPETPETTEYVLGYRMYLVKLKLSENDPTSQQIQYVDPGRVGLEKEVSTEPLSLTKLPPGVIISDDDKQSTLIGSNVTNGTESLNNIETGAASSQASYFAFQFRADGSVNLPTNKKWFMTLMGRDEYIKGQEKTPSNYICLQLNAYNGELRWLQPN